MTKRFRVNDKDYDYDPDGLYDLTFGEARAIKANTGLTIADWQYGLASFYRGDIDVIRAMIWLVCKRSEDPVTWVEMDEWSMTDFLGSVSNVEEPDEDPVTEDRPEPETKATPKGNGKAQRKRPQVVKDTATAS